MKTSLASAKIDGRIETAADGVVVGWAWRKGVPEPVRVEVLVEGEVVATVTAKAKRGSLRRAGIGNGRHGFAVTLPEELAGAGERRLEVVVLPDRVPLTAAAAYSGASASGAWRSTRLVLSDRSASPPIPEAEPPAMLANEDAAPVSQGVPGVVESVADGIVAGWVADPIAGVTVTVAGTVVAEASADVPRPDLGGGGRGFRVALPDSLLAAGPHVLTVEGEGTPLLAAANCLRPAVASSGVWADADLRLALLDDDAISAPSPRSVLGPGGWRFEEHGPPPPLDDAEVERLAARVGAWRAAHRDLSLPYVLAVLPARERLERRHLPASLAAADASATVERLITAPGDGLVDLLPVLESARAERPVSLRTGGLTAWGAIAAARAVLTAAAAGVPDLPVPAADDFPLVPVCSYRGELAGRRTVMTEGDLAVELPPPAIPAVALGEETELVAADALTALRAPTSAHLVDPDRPAAAAVFDRPAASDLRLLVLGSALPPLLAATVAEQVGRCVVLDRVEPPLETIELELPHAVLHVLHERDLRALATADG